VKLCDGEAAGLKLDLVQPEQ